jgi:hypothetical protein
LVGYAQYVLEKGRFLGVYLLQQTWPGLRYENSEEFVQKALGRNGVSLRFTEVSSAAVPGRHLGDRGCPLMGWHRLRSCSSGEQMASSVSMLPLGLNVGSILGADV